MTNISKLSLAALSQRINAQTRTVDFVADDGSISQMVFIPKFTIPAGSFENGKFPASDLNLGGFFIDKYQCSHKSATPFARGIGDNPTVAADSTDAVAVSQPGKVPWTHITQPNANQACANRKINGVACHLVTMREWATVCYLTKLLGHDIRGNNNYGHDIRDANTWEKSAVTDPTQKGRTLTGTGPVSWSHNGSADGVFDIVGNVWEWMDFTITDGVYTHKKRSRINDSDGIIQIENEIISYGAIDYQGNGKAVLSSCVRGQLSTTAAIHADNTVVHQLTKYCITPGGATATIANSDGLSASATAIVYTDLINGPGNNGFAVGDTLQAGNEQMKVTAVVSNTLTVERGINGSTAVLHAKGTAVAKLSAQLSNVSPANDAYQQGYLTTMRTENDLACMALPFSGNAQTNEYKDGFWIRNHGVRAAIRGAYWDYGALGRAGFALSLNIAPSDWGSILGFRAALSLENL